MHIPRRPLIVSPYKIVPCTPFHVCFNNNIQQSYKTTAVTPSISHRRTPYTIQREHFPYGPFISTYLRYKNYGKQVRQSSYKQRVPIYVNMYSV